MPERKRFFAVDVFPKSGETLGTATYVDHSCCCYLWTPLSILLKVYVDSFSCCYMWTPLGQSTTLAPAAWWSDELVEKLAQKRWSCCIGNSSLTRLQTFAGVILTQLRWGGVLLQQGLATFVKAHSNDHFSLTLFPTCGK